jgi:predicted MFS family arabinose efflux permease
MEGIMAMNSDLLDTGNGISASTPRLRHLTLGWLTIVFSINFLDRQVLSLFAQPIKQEFQLTDSMIGMLYGIGFALIYGTGGFPIARIADRGRRVPIVNWALMFFSLMTVVSAFVTGFWQLALARIGVAAGESGTNPPSHSIIADLYTPRERSVAMAVFSLGPHIGVLAGFLVLGWIGGHWGWRAAFASVGVVGIVVAIAGLISIREPPRRKRADSKGSPYSTVEALKIAFRSRAARHVFVGSTIFSTMSNAMLGWLPTAMVRQGMSVPEVGTTLAILLGLVGACGTLLGGIVSDRISKGDPAVRLKILSLVILFCGPAWASVFQTHSPTMMIVLLVVPAGLLGFYLGPTFSTIQSLAEPGVRATAAAALVFSGNVIGLSVGPFVVGSLSDAFASAAGKGSLAIALTCITPLCIWSAWHYWQASHTVAADVVHETA